MRDRPAERGQAEAQKGGEDLKPGTSRGCALFRAVHPFALLQPARKPRIFLAPEGI
jgi:hypothetical protein